MKYQVSTVCPTLLGVLCAVIQSASGLAKPSFQVSALPQDTYRYGTNNGDVLSRASMGCIATAMNITYFNGRWINIKADGGERMLNDSDERIMIRNGNVIVADHVGTNAIINNLSYFDNGTYRCEIRENDATGAPISDWANATVDLILEVRLQPANNDSLVRTFNDSQYVELTCDMSGYIRLDEDLYWIIDGVEISSSGLKYRVRYRNGQNVAQFGGNSTIASRVTVLTVLDVTLTDSSREYFCAIRNTDLILRFILEVTPSSRPSGYPQSVAVRPISSTVLEILWEDVPDDERNGNITHYEIIYTLLTTVAENEKTPTIFVTNGPVLSSLLRGLEEYTVYNVSVRAVTVVGPGPLSPTATGQTLEDVPSGAPRNLVVVSLNKDTFQVSWDRPEEAQINGVLRLYKLRYCGPIGESGQLSSRSSCKEVEVDGVVSGYLLSNLKESTTYNISVAAFTIGNGPAAWVLATTRTPQLELGPGGGTSLVVVGVVIGVLVGVATIVLVASIIIGVVLREKLSRSSHKRIARHEEEREAQNSPSSSLPVSSDGNTAVQAKESSDLSSVSVGEELTQPITFTVPQNSTTVTAVHPDVQQDTPQDADAQPKLELSEVQTQEPPLNCLTALLSSREEPITRSIECDDLEASVTNINAASARQEDEKENSQVASLELISDVKLDLFDPEISGLAHD